VVKCIYLGWKLVSKPGEYKQQARQINVGYHALQYVSSVTPALWYKEFYFGNNLTLINFYIKFFLSHFINNIKAFCAHVWMRVIFVQYCDKISPILHIPLVWNYNGIKFGNYLVLVWSVVSVWQASTCNTDTTPTKKHRNSNTQITKNNKTNVVIKQNT